MNKKNKRLIFYSLGLGVVLSIPLSILISIIILKIPPKVLYFIFFIALFVSYIGFKKFENMIGFRHKYSITPRRAYGSFNIPKENVRNIFINTLFRLSYGNITINERKDKVSITFSKPLKYKIKNKETKKKEIFGWADIFNKKIEIEFYSRYNPIVKQEAIKLFNNLGSNKKIKLTNILT